MFTKSVAAWISRPPDEVFAFVEDAWNRPQWPAGPCACRAADRSQPQKNLDRGFPRLKQLLETGTAG